MTVQNRKTQNQLEKELIQQTQRLSSLFTVLTEYHQLDDLDEMMHLALDQVLLISTSQVGSIHLLNDKADHLHLAAHKGLSEHILDEISQNSAYDELLGRIIALKKSLLITDFSKEPSFAVLSQIEGWQVFLGIPIVSTSRNWGILVICGDETLHGISGELKLLEIIAGQIGIALENQRLREQSERFVIVEERNRLARELHDSVTQSLYSLTLFAETAKRLMKAGNLDGTRNSLDEITSLSQQALKEMRLLVHNLRPTTHRDIGLVNSLEQRLQAVEGRSGVKYELKADRNLPLHPDVENELYAVAVEALNNALKHARANHIQVALYRKGKSISMEIKDNGKGFDLSQAEGSGGFGLASMQERVKNLNGEIHFNSRPNEGTDIHVQIPLTL